eukprot:5600988-Amphidinium_carterae.1
MYDNHHVLDLATSPRRMTPTSAEFHFVGNPCKHIHIAGKRCCVCKPRLEPSAQNMAGLNQNGTIVAGSRQGGNCLQAPHCCR